MSVQLGAAEAHPNIALVKYWGKRDAALNLPAVGSLSITLNTLWTRSRVRFDPAWNADRVQLNGLQDDATTRRVSALLDVLRERAGVTAAADVVSINNFPTGAGLASSASGFAALVVAAADALGLSLAPAEASALARRGSGSAARSIFGGYVEWARGQQDDGSDSVAAPLLSASEWPLRVLVAVTSRVGKAVGSTDGMERTRASSPYWDAWLATQEADLQIARRAVAERDFAALAAVAEHSCLKMHALAMAAEPGLLYWNGATVAAMQRVRTLAAEGLPVFFTIDAGPQLKAICLPEAAAEVARALRDCSGVLEVIEAGLGEGARTIDPAQFEATG